MFKKISSKLINLILILFSINLTMYCAKSAEFITTTIEYEGKGKNKYTVLTVNFSEKLDLILVDKNKLNIFKDSLLDGKTIIEKSDFLEKTTENFRETNNKNILKLYNDNYVVKNIVNRENLLSNIEDLGVSHNGFGSIHLYNYKNSDDMDIIRKSLNKLFERRLLNQDISFTWYCHNDTENKNELETKMKEAERYYQNMVLEKKYIS